MLCKFVSDRLVEQSFLLQLRPLAFFLIHIFLCYSNTKLTRTFAFFTHQTSALPGEDLPHSVRSDVLHEGVVSTRLQIGESLGLDNVVRK